MYVNESPLDRVIRLVLGSALILFGLFGLSGTAGTAAAVIGGVLVFTAVTGFCALYKVFGICTNDCTAGKARGAKKAA